MPAFSDSKLSVVNTPVKLAAMGAAERGTVNIRCATTSDLPEKVTVYIGPASASPTDVHVIEHQVEISRSNPLINTGEILAPGEAVYIRASSTTVVCRVSGEKEVN